MTISLPPISYPAKPRAPFTGTPPQNLFPDRFPTEWKNIPGKPYITVSSKGLANGLSEYINDGADFGPDSLQADGTLTDTLGIQEAGIYAIANGIGRINIIGSYGNKFMLNTNVLLYYNEVSNPTPPQPLEIVGIGEPYIQASTSFANTPINGNSSYSTTMIVILNLPTLVTIKGLILDGNNTVEWGIAGTANEVIVEYNKAINFTDTGINITSMDFSDAGTQIADKVIIRNNFCNNNAGADINTEGMNEIITNNMCFSGNGASTQTNIIAETAVSVIITGNHCANGVAYAISVESGSANSAENGKVVVSNNICESSGDGIMVNTESSTQVLTDIIIESNIIRKTTGTSAIVIQGTGTNKNVSIQGNVIADTSATYEIYIGGGAVFENLNIHNNMIYNNTGSGTTRNPIYVTSGTTISGLKITENFIGAGEGQIVVPSGAGYNPSPTLSANPPASGTAYQNTNPYDIEIDLPVYASTSGTAGYVTIAKGASSTPTAIGNQFVSGSTSSTSTDIIKLRVPAGWYYSFTGSGVTFATATPFAE